MDGRRSSALSTSHLLFVMKSFLQFGNMHRQVFCSCRLAVGYVILYVPIISCTDVIQLWKLVWSCQSVRCITVRPPCAWRGGRPRLSHTSHCYSIWNLKASIYVPLSTPSLSALKVYSTSLRLTISNTSLNSSVVSLISGCGGGRYSLFVFVLRSLLGVPYSCSSASRAPRFRIFRML